MSVDLLGIFGKLNVTPIILPVYLEFGGDMMGVGFAALIQARISARPSIIAMPLLIFFFPVAFFFCTIMKNVVFLDGCHIPPEYPFSLKSISIHACCKLSCRSFSTACNRLRDLVHSGLL